MATASEEIYGDTTKEKFPDTLKGFGYVFNNEGCLRKINTETNEPSDEPFQFTVSNDPAYNQRHYEALGEVISDYVQDLMETDLKLDKLDVPLGEDFFKKTFIYVTKDVLINPDRLLILVHGSGVVRAGQWARSLIINDCLETGSQIPYINQARALGYAVMVLNTNDNKREIDGKTVPIKHSGSPMEHFKYVWKTYVKDAKARHIAIVAHSYGGVVTVDMATQFFSDFNSRVYAIAFTDSVHTLTGQKVPSKVQAYLRKVARNWVADTLQLDAPTCHVPNDIPAVSAGHPKHEMTSSACMSSVFTFLEERYAALPGTYYKT